MPEKWLAKITHVTYGFGGYGDAMFGFGLDFASNGRGIGSWNGMWARKPDKYCQWTVEDQDKIFAETARLVLDTLRQAKKTTVQDLVGVPVEITTEDNALKSWRILEEVL